MREAERNACMNNNIGIGNTFVWASRYSDTSNYMNMVEDIDNPQNNVCFVRVELKSNDSAISAAELPFSALATAARFNDTNNAVFSPDDPGIELTALLTSARNCF